jgi:hypothetical protein
MDVNSEPQVGEQFVWLAAEEGKWQEQLETVRGVLGKRRGGRFLVEWWDDDDEKQKMVTLVRRDDQGRLVRAD